MYSVAMNWNPNQLPTSSIAPMFARTRELERRIPRRTSGTATRRSIATNEARMAATPANEPSVRAVAHPTSGASTTV